jgi:uncharacterized protein YqjF (DUF2071 family)
VPDRPWLWRQRWHDLLFIHWRVPTVVVRPLIPAPLHVDTFHATAWIGLVPFRMTGVTLRGWPSVPWLSAFSEMNLRTYVTDGTKPGVWFLRMDASRALAAWAARWSLGLPYVWSRMAIRQVGSRFHYSVERGAAQFKGNYGPVGPAIEPPAGSLDGWLTERYCLYCAHAGHLLRVEIHHHPWPLQPATLELETNTIARVTRLPEPGEAPLLHFAGFQNVVGWNAEPLGPLGVGTRPEP